MSGISDAEIAYVRGVPAPALPPPIKDTGVFGWLRANVLSTPANVVLTILAILTVAWLLPPLVRFLVIDAVWTGADREACLATLDQPHPGACWPFIRDRWGYFVYGSYPRPERWRVDIFFALLAFGISWLLWLDAPRRDIGAAYFFIVLPL